MSEHTSGKPGRAGSARRFWKPDVAGEVDEEILFHIEQRMRDLLANGVSEQQAREQAEREFGDHRLIREEMVSIDAERERTDSRREYFADWRQDIRLSARGLRRSPLFSVMAIACIALGVSVATTVFAAINAILLRPLPFAQPEQLAMVYGQAKARNINGANISWPDYVRWRDAEHNVRGNGNLDLVHTVAFRRRRRGGACGRCRRQRQRVSAAGCEATAGTPVLVRRRSGGQRCRAHSELRFMEPTLRRRFLDNQPHRHSRREAVPRDWCDAAPFQFS